MLIVLYLVIGFLVATGAIAVAYADEYYLDEMETLITFILCIMFWIFILPAAISMYSAKTLGKKIVEWREQENDEESG